MEIPPPCQLWEQTMAAGSDDTRAILANIRVETCLEAGPQARFFSGLAVSFHPSEPATGAEARAASRQVVMGAKEHLLCLGRQVEDDRFRELMRLQRPSSLEYCIPEDQREEAVGSGVGFTPDVLANIDRDIVAAFLEGYDGPVDTANQFGITWGADMAEVGPVLSARPLELRNRLGLSDWQNESYGILLSYARTEVAGGLHVPRVFDGVDSPAFALVADCTATVGRTKPLHGDVANGFTEVVHRGSRVRPRRFETILVNE